MGCLCSTASWKRQQLPDRTWDYVDVRDFKEKSCWVSFKYGGIFLLCFKNILVYIADIWVAVLLFVPAFAQGTDVTGNNGSLQEDGFWPPVIYRKYLILASIIVSFLILLWDLRKARKVIISRDISFAYTW